jgi:hypothetical protein
MQSIGVKKTHRADEHGDGHAEELDVHEQQGAEVRPETPGERSPPPRHALLDVVQVQHV